MFGNNSFGNTSFGNATFGANFRTPPTMNAFGSTPQQAQQPQGPIGTTIRFVPLSGTDSVPKTGSTSGTSQITTRHQNISAMKEYETKSVDELRLEDYAANRKVGQPSHTSPFQMGTGFGAPAANTGGLSLFNNNQQTNTSAFGSLATPNKTTSLFSTPTTNTTSIFGSNPSTSKGFGLNQQTNAVASPFGAPQNNSIFAPAAQQPQQTSLFGTTNQASTTTQPFGFASNTTNQTPSLFNTSLNNDANKPAFPLPTASIFNTGLTNDANKSAFAMPNSNSMFNFGGTSTATTNPLNTSSTTTPLFGQAQPSTGLSLFNNNTQANNNSAFGSLATQNKPNSLFSTPATNTTSIFGSNQTAAKPFGLSQPTASVASPFGTAQTNSIFAPATQQTQTTSLFGTTNQASTTTQPFGFSATTNQTPSLFNTSLNNDANKSAFPQQTSSIFNTGLTNDANKPAFSMPTSNSLFNFGGTSTATTIPLNTSSTTAPLFGQPATSTAGSGLFSNINSTNNLSFGTQNTSNSLFNLPSAQNNLSNPLQPQTQTTTNIQQSPDLLLNRLKTLPYGESSLYLSDADSSTGLGSFKFTTDPKTINQYKMNAKTNVKLNKPASTEKTRSNSVLFDGLDDHNTDDMRCAIDVFVPKKSIKKLDLKPSNYQSEGDNERIVEHFLPFERSRSMTANSTRENISDIGESTPISRRVRYADNTFPGSHGNASIVSHIANISDSSEVSSLQNTSYRRSNTSNELHLNSSSRSNRSFTNLKCGIIHSRRDYHLKPSIEEIERRYNPDNDTCIIDSLLIERPNYGSILFESPLDVKGLNLDEIVHIRRKEVIVYPNDDVKPPLGQGLNRPAVVTLHQVWPIDKSNNEVIKDIDRLLLMRYPEKIESATVEKGARFIEYRAETGSWVFSVKHFSKYGITDDDEEVDQNVISTLQQSKLPSTPLGSQNAPSTNGVHQVNQVNSMLVNRHKTSPLSVTFQDNFKQQPKTEVSTKVIRSPDKFVVTPKTDLKLDKHKNVSYISNDGEENSSLIDVTSVSRDMSMRAAIDQLFEDDEEILSKSKDMKRSFSVHGTKRLALQHVSPNVSATSYERPIIVGAVVPKQQKIREIKLKPDLYAARNEISRDITSVCISGSPRVRFSHGSRRFCYIQGDSVQIQELKLVSTNDDGSLQHEIEEQFETFLESNSLVTSLSMNPILAPYIETNDFISNASSHDLLHALYGNLTTKTPYAKQDERLNRVINWLAATNRKLPLPSNLYQQIIYYMSCDRYDIAANLAIENNHPRLALLVATLNLNKDLMFEQLSSWRLSTADQYIDPELFKIYILLAGLTEWKLSNEETVYCLKGLEWTQQLSLLALHVTTYVSEPDKYGFHMLPLYIKRLDTDTDDVDYHILARHNPANALSATSSLVEEWFLLESLKSFRVINSESECLNSDIIHCNLASQLAPIDLRWACFVALHIINNEVRNQVLVNCLEQNHNQFKKLIRDANNRASPTTTTVESWLIEKLRIPKEFIDNSRKLALKSG